MQGGADQHAVDQAVDAQAKGGQGHRSKTDGGYRGEDQRAEQLAQVVEQGRHGGEEEMLVGLQAGHHQPADGEDERGDQVEAHELDNEVLLLGAKAGSHADLAFDQRSGQQGNGDGKSASYQKGQVGDAREKLPGLVAALFGERFGEHGDKGHGQRAARDEHEEQVGDVVGDIVGAELGGELELARHQDQAAEADDFVNAEEEGDEEGGAGESGHEREA